MVDSGFFAQCPDLFATVFRVMMCVPYHVIKLLL